MNKVIELHRKSIKGTSRFSVDVASIIEVAEAKFGAYIRFSLSNGCGYLIAARCIESYDEVMRLIKSV